MVRALRLAGLPHLTSGPDTGRFTAQEPIETAGGAAGATAGRNTDWYGYCPDDPVHGRDPEGLETRKYGGADSEAGKARAEESGDDNGTAMSRERGQAIQQQIGPDLKEWGITMMKLGRDARADFVVDMINKFREGSSKK